MVDRSKQSRAKTTHVESHELSVESSEVGARLERVRRLKTAGRLQEALAELLELAAENPDSPLVSYECASAYDRLGDEEAAIPLYERAIANGLSGDELRGALVGLGSSRNVVGDRDGAVAAFERGRAQFPGAREFDVFLALALHGLKQHGQALRMALLALIDTTFDPNIRKYERAIRYYADSLDD